MIFNYSDEKWNECFGYWTAKEIKQQPETWKKTLKQVGDLKVELSSFLKDILDNDDYDVICSGAGTSEFVGNAIYSYLAKKTNYHAKSYGTTDIVAAPENYLSAEKPTLMISFARSGNSPESVAAVECANKICKNIKHLFITCNIDGALSKFAEGNENCFALNLTKETHDQSFAMTSSFSNMYLAAVACFNLDDYDDFTTNVNVIIDTMSDFVENRSDEAIDIINEVNFNRIVYLGSNVNKGIAQESALKMCELTAGKVDTNYDTPMGFRHGPKSVINDTTLTVIYLSNNEYTRKYEMDVVKEIGVQRKENKLVVVSAYEDEELAKYCDYVINLNNSKKVDDIYLGIQYIIIGQLLGLYKSLAYNITPDNPCPSGEVNRVVKGVKIYPY